MTTESTRVADTDRRQAPQGSPAADECASRPCRLVRSSMSDRTAVSDGCGPTTGENAERHHPGRGEFHAPSLADFFPPAVLFEGTPFELDRLMLIRSLMSVLVAAFFVFAMRSPKIVPRGMQNVAEIALDFVRINIAEEILGKEQGKRFLPVITTIFFIGGRLQPDQRSFPS